MAKVMISMPDELLARVDAEARRRGLTRSATIRELATATLDSRNERLAAAMRALEGKAEPHGGDVVADLKASRPR